MNERQQDFELLRRYTRHGEQSAFADLVRRHIDLVFATALRKVADAGAAQEIAQNVFSALARKAWRFAPDDSLPSWLHKAALLESKTWLRGELGRRRREETAAQLGTTMNNSEDQPEFRALVPLLDEALLSLREKDRTALLLRFYESQSLRDLGQALGVGEDAAQKRVQGALEKLSEFFRRRGFKSATATASAAALQQSAASASVMTVSAVVNATLQTAPPVVAGLTAIFARFTGLTQVQSVALCITVAAIPVLWQWNQNHLLASETDAARSRLALVQTDRERFSAENARLGNQLQRLETEFASNTANREREREATARLEMLKAKTRALLTSDDYRWPEDLPFVRVPKSAVSTIRSATGANTPAQLATKVDRFLDLAPQEREITGQIFTNYFAGIEQHFETSLYETNLPMSFKLPPGAESKVFVLLPMGEKIRGAIDQLCADLATTLGEERWNMVKPEKWEFTHYEQVRLLGYSQFAWDQSVEIAVNLSPNPGGEPAVSLTTSGGTAVSSMPLRSFLSEPARGVPSLIGLSQGPPRLVERVKRYLTAEAVARLTKPGIK